MSCILHIETSTDICSVALSENGACIFKQESTEERNHARLVAPYADEAISFADSHAIPLDAVAVSMGPGSYTGLRIGVSVAKGICYARDLKLIALPTLKVMCVPILLRDELPEDAWLCPMIDARRMEVYSCIYDRSLKEMRPICAEVITADSFKEELTEHPVYFFGDGAKKCQSLINHANAHFIEGIVPKAKHMFPLAEQAFVREHFEDVAYFEPYYLKQFVPGQPKSVLSALRKDK
ncbi:tRNA (adenosine(37)-N6)-threonylcarbamoyltransferase complex dimerization subunit type 1 TsaB [Pseudoprevotella muciniphila]|uniref:tRNA (Adenosine(37)-N6)-threonylcarbamoyltransferase complex dimerization subunit type 1 TsaB n=1 Tax=Pseudoprevotella muciniphila TaxID=2133944 RepID=A0A5P8E408_9BACT|nr:tRNA (adenosine(37)-N6)-threonylcarbamoyltransferase complex dimerization subunit type 1 TsaB [Pseudoprevotella muciniphila]QFQ11745.1 tRNA (adenosine(37)-N6)-threonylcarbamoyltransferase complex dimerization subunit type 1 TsaB [Pseudoprevotella muciniphila]